MQNNPATLIDPSGLVPAGPFETAGRAPRGSRVKSPDDECFSTLGGLLDAYAVNAACLGTQRQVNLDVAQRTSAAGVTFAGVGGPLAGPGILVAAAPSGSNDEQANSSVTGSDGSGGKPSLGAVKRALRKVEQLVGRLPKGEPGKFGSPQRGTPKKGYRLDPPHPGRPPGDPESGPHINWWDYEGGKRGRGGASGAIPIED